MATGIQHYCTELAISDQHLPFAERKLELSAGISDCLANLHDSITTFNLSGRNRPSSDGIVRFSTNFEGIAGYLDFPDGNFEKPTTFGFSEQKPPMTASRAIYCS
jgi:hypothetical protein